MIDMESKCNHFVTNIGVGKVQVKFWVHIHSAHRNMYTIQCTVYNVQCTMYNIH